MNTPRFRRLAGRIVLVAAALFVRAGFGAEDIDFDHARQLLQKQKQGERLTPAEEAELSRACAARQEAWNAESQPPFGGELREKDRANDRPRKQRKQRAANPK